MKLQNKILLSIVFLLIFFGTLTAISTYFLTLNEFSKKLTTNLIDNTHAQSQALNQILKQSRDVSSLLANRPVVRQYLTDQSDKALKNQLEDHFLDGFNLSNNYLAIYLLDNSGNTLFSTDPRFLSQNYTSRDYFAQALLGEPTTEISLGLTSNELGYYFSTPIFSLEDETKVLGVAVAKLDPKLIEDILLLDNQNSESNIMFTDRNGVIVVSSDKEKEFSSLGSLPPKVLDQLRQYNTYGKDNFNNLDYDILQEEVNNQNISGKTIKIQDKVDNKEEVISMSKIRDFPYYLVFEGNFDTISQISLKTSLLISGFVVMVSILSIIAISILLRYYMDKQEKAENEIAQRAKELETLNKLMIGRELKMIDLKNQLKNKIES